MISNLLILAAWLACGVLAAGFFLAKWDGESPYQRQKDYRGNLGICLFYGLVFGPAALLIGFFYSGFGEHGWYLRRQK